MSPTVDDNLRSTKAASQLAVVKRLQNQQACRTIINTVMNQSAGQTIKMNATETQAFNDLQQFCIAVNPNCNTFGWSCVQQNNKKPCMQYLHEPSGLTLQSPGSAHLAVLALTATDSRAISAATTSSSHEEYSDEADQFQQTIHVITSLDKVILQLQKHANELHPYHDDDNNSSKTVATSTTVQANAASQIADVNDVCAFIRLTRMSLSCSSPILWSQGPPSCDVNYCCVHVRCLGRNFCTNHHTQVVTDSTVFRHF